MGNKLTSNSKSHYNVSKQHQNEFLTGNGQEYTVIADKTTEALAAHGQPSSIANNRSIVPNGATPLSEQQPPSKPQSTRRKDYSRGAARMFFPSSGHMGFEIVKTSDELPSIEIIDQMIGYETSIRLSEPIQELMDMYHMDEAAVTYIHDLIQQHVVECFGYHDVNALRTALYRFPDEPAIKTAFYVKHNKLTQGLINQGQCARDVDLFTLEGHHATLFSQISAGQPMVLLAGSTS